MTPELDTTPELGTPPEGGSVFRVQKGWWVAASWGYDQTNASFWLVTKRTGETAWLKEYHHTNRSIDGVMQGVVPNPHEPVLEHLWQECSEYELGRPHPRTDVPCLVQREYRRKIQAAGTDNEHIIIRRPFLVATPWLGKPMYDTIAFGYPGH